MADLSPKPSLVDDPSFLASLSELDDGLDAPGDSSRAAGAASVDDSWSDDLDLAPQPGLDPLPTALPSAVSTESTSSRVAAAPEASGVVAEDAFDTRPDPRFLYRSTALNHAAQELLGAIGRRDGVVVLTGDEGVGKTTLCQFVLGELDRRTVTSFVSHRLSTADELLKTVLVDFGVMSRDDLAGRHVVAATHEGLMTALRDFLASLAVLHASAVLLIDDAQWLPLAVLQHLRVLSDVLGPRLLQIVLVGGPDLAGVLDQYELRQLNEAIGTPIVLQPLSANEIRPYVLFRLGVVGAHAAGAFDAHAFQKLFSLSRGNPRTVNLLCARALVSSGQRSAGAEANLFGEVADDVDRPAPRGAHGFLWTAFIAACLFALVLVGAASAAWVFRDSLARMTASWQVLPAAPPVPPPPR